MTHAFNVLDYIEGAEKIGIKREHAEYHARTLSKLVNDELVTKSFLKQELSNLEYRTIIKLGGIMVVCSGLIIGILGLMIKL